MNINIFDSAIIVAAIAGGITGALVAVVVSLGTIRAQRHLGGTTFGAPQPSSEWRVPSGPLARHLAHADAPTQQEQKNEATRPTE